MQRIRSNARSCKMSTVQAVYPFGHYIWQGDYYQCKVSIRMLHLARHQLPTESTLVTCVQMLHLAYITCPWWVSVGVLFLARCQLSTQRSLATCVPMLHLAYIASPHCASVGMLFLAMHQLSTQRTRSNATSGEVSTTPTENSHDLRSNTTSGGTSTIHTE